MMTCADPHESTWSMTGSRIWEPLVVGASRNPRGAAFGSHRRVPALARAVLLPLAASFIPRASHLTE